MTEEIKFTDNAVDAGISYSAEGQGVVKEPEVVVPEKYELNFGENEVDAELVSEFETLAKEMKLQNVDAQKLVDLRSKIVTQEKTKVEELTNKVFETWTAELKADKDIGGDKLGENLSFAKKAVKEFGNKDLESLLDKFDAEKNPNGTGIGQNPQLIKFLIAVGKGMSQDNKIVKGDIEIENNKSFAQVMYGQK